MIHIEAFLEEPSAQVSLEHLVPRILGAGATCQPHLFRGKQDLLRKLPQRLKGLASWLPPYWRILVLVDQDRVGCLELKGKLEEWAAATGLHTRSRPDSVGRFAVVNRIVVEELEAWFFGDMQALRVAYPRLPETLNCKAQYRLPDRIRDPAGALERELKAAGYYPSGMPKIEVARAISAHMEPERNTSRSFQVFRDGLLALAGRGAPKR